MGKLSGKVALVTGGGRGQGRAHALRLAEEGAQVIVTDIPAQVPSVEYPLASREDLDETARQVEATGQRCLAIQADARSLAAMNDAVAQGVDQFGRLDCVVINHGISLGVTWDGPEQAMLDMLDINLKGVLFTSSAVIPQMIKQGDGGSIVMISSITAIRPIRGASVYVAAKAGVLGLMRALSAELGDHRIRVNAICPGTVNTPMVNNDITLSRVCGVESGGTLEAADLPLRSQNVLPELWMEPREIANAALFLVSDDARSITGITMPVDLGNLNQPSGAPPSVWGALADARAASAP